MNGSGTDSLCSEHFRTGIDSLSANISRQYPKEPDHAEKVEFEYTDREGFIQHKVPSRMQVNMKKLENDDAPHISRKRSAPRPLLPLLR